MDVILGHGKWVESFLLIGGDQPLASSDLLGFDVDRCRHSSKKDSDIAASATTIYDAGALGVLLVAWPNSCPQRMIKKGTCCDI